MFQAGNSETLYLMSPIKLASEDNRNSPWHMRNKKAIVDIILAMIYLHGINSTT